MHEQIVLGDRSFVHRRGGRIPQGISRKKPRLSLFSPPTQAMSKNKRLDGDSTIRLASNGVSTKVDDDEGLKFQLGEI